MSNRAPFGADSARRVLEQTCSMVGIDPTDAKLMRLGENAIFILSSPPMVVRISRGMHHADDSAKEVRVAQWLAKNNIKSARLFPIAQPVEIDGHPVTFWQVVPDSGVKARAGELGSVLRSVHGCPISPELSLPALNSFGRVEARIESAHGIDSAVRTFLHERLHELVEAFTELTFIGEPVALHGDAHVQNIIRTPEGESVLIDFEGFCFGPREVDLAVTATEYEVGWHSDRDYEDFCSAYGTDVRAWSGFQVLRDANLFKMTTWLMQNVQESREVAEEFERRLEALRRPAELAALAWQPF